MTLAPRRRGGFSLIELMVSLAILMLVTVYLTDMNDFAAFDEVYGSYFEGTTVVV